MTRPGRKQGSLEIPDSQIVPDSQARRDVSDSPVTEHDRTWKGRVKVAVAKTGGLPLNARKPKDDSKSGGMKETFWIGCLIAAMVFMIWVKVMPLKSGPVCTCVCAGEARRGSAPMDNEWNRT